jgi:hypothetical protein
MCQSRHHAECQGKSKILKIRDYNKRKGKEMPPKSIEEDQEVQERKIEEVKICCNLQIEELWLQKPIQPIPKACQKVQFCKLDYIHQTQ